MPSADIARMHISRGGMRNGSRFKPAGKPYRRQIHDRFLAMGQVSGVDSNAQKHDEGTGLVPLFNYRRRSAASKLLGDHCDPSNACANGYEPGADGSGIAPPPLRPQDAGEARRSVEQGPPKRGRGAPTCWGSDREGGRSGRRPHASVSGRIPIAATGPLHPPPRFTGMRPRRRAGPRHRHLCRTRIFRSGPGRGKCLATAPPIPTFPRKRGKE